MERARIRDLGISIGNLPTGPYNAITDVAGVWVGHTTLIYDTPRIARTGVTMIVPREGDIWKDHAFAGYYSFNGTGEMTGMHWLSETGLLHYPIAITNTHQVGTVHEALVAYGQENGLTELSSLAVVAETWDGLLNDLDAFHVKKEHVLQALTTAKSGPVPEGNVGGGTGMICHGFKGGIGTASRVVNSAGQTYTVGALVQANYGSRKDLRLDGVPVGRILDFSRVPNAWQEHPPPSTSSIIIIVATDAPLLPVQCQRLARRAAVGLSRTGGIGHNNSGDIFLAFATGNHILKNAKQPHSLQMLPHEALDIFFDAVAEVVEESIWNALTQAETMTGYKGHLAHAIPLDALQEIVRKYQIPT